MERRVDLVIDPLRGEKVPVSLPLAYRVPLERSREELGLPTTVDLADPIVAKAVALASAARRAAPTVRFAVFGGVAHRFISPTSNDPILGLRHELHDLDVAVLVREARGFQRFLAEVGSREGSGLTFFETSGDRIYNSLSDGQRFRWHMVVAQKGTEVVLGTLDIVADEFRFCHRFDVRAYVEAAPRNGWTLSPAHLLLAKGQFILRIEREAAAPIPDRVLEPFGKRHLLIGPEAKDVRDLLALLHDHALGEAPGEISWPVIESVLEHDWGLWRTFGLNLAMLARSPILRGLSAPARTQIEERLSELIRRVGTLNPKKRFGLFGGRWWQEVDTTPSVDATVRID